jgi:hypothetical protein
MDVAWLAMKQKRLSMLYGIADLQELFGGLQLSSTFLLLCLFLGKGLLVGDSG